jgi:hypothetical protein
VKRIYTIVALVVTVGVITGVAYLLWVVFSAIVGWLSSQESQVAAAIIAAWVR